MRSFAKNETNICKTISITNTAFTSHNPSLTANGTYLNASNLICIYTICDITPGYGALFAVSCELFNKYKGTAYLLWFCLYVKYRNRRWGMDPSTLFVIGLQSRWNTMKNISSLIPWLLMTGLQVRWQALTSWPIQPKVCDYAMITKYRFPDRDC